MTPGIKAALTERIQFQFYYEKYFLDRECVL